MLNTTLNNRYQIRHELGNGGMGKVFLALDTYLEREVAVKLLNRPNLGAAGRALLLNEARAAARLSHPNIVMVFDVGEQDDMPYIINYKLSKFVSCQGRNWLQFTDEKSKPKTKKHSPAYTSHSSRQTKTTTR